MKKKILFIIFILAGLRSWSQIDSSLLKAPDQDSDSTLLNMDAVYNRPFLLGNSQIALGGYLEADYRYEVSEGVSDGHSLSIPRMTVFIAGSMHPKLRFLSEIEIEEGGEEISIEFAALDVLIRPLFNFRGGVIMNPIGAFNQNHDGPKWEFVQRPMPMTHMLPATWSNPGFGFFGKYVSNKKAISYEYYLTNGFDTKIIDNTEGRTFLPATKQSKERFTESFNGYMLQTAKIGGRIGNFELGISYMGGVYNQPSIDDLSTGTKDKLHVVDLDFNFSISELRFIGEVAWIKLDVPETYTQQYGNQQIGGFFDLVYPFKLRPFWGFNEPRLNLALRYEMIDWNLESFNETGENIGDFYSGIITAISFRPVPLTVLRINYRIEGFNDLLNNEVINTRAIEFGISTYF